MCVCVCGASVCGTQLRLLLCDASNQMDRNPFFLNKKI